MERERDRESRVLRVDGSGPSDPSASARPGGSSTAAIGEAASALGAGGLVVFPTETVYGLGADATDASAVASVFVAKGRPATDPLIVHVADVATAESVSVGWDRRAAALAERFWPGPLTIVTGRAASVVPAVGAGADTVGLRVPAHPVALGLLEAFGRPVAAPSANRFGRVSPTTAEHVVEELSGRFDVLLDAGPCPLGVESTVLDLTGAVPVVLRPGGVTLEDLRGVLGRVDHRGRLAVAEGETSASPGQLLGHYAPTTPTVLVEAGPSAAESLADRLDELGVRAALVRLDPDARRAAASLYAELRAADRLGADLVLVHGVDGAGLGRAVNDRLFRAAHGRVVPVVDDAAVRRLVGLVARA